MKFLIFLIFSAHLFLSCKNQNFENDGIPEEVDKIISLSQTSPDYLNLHVDISNTESDSLIINTYIVNSSNTYTDTLYHASNFPLFVAYVNNSEITPPLEKQIFFDDLNITFLKADTRILVNSNKVKKITSTPYNIIALFRYKQNPNDIDSEHFWLASEPLKVK
jgi:hypothetical protein